MRLTGITSFGLLCVSLCAFADGPASRKLTDPHAVTSASGPPATALPVEALLTTTRIYGVAHSNNGRKIAFVSSASGRPNLWVMNLDGTGAQQLIKSEDRQAGARFTHDDAEIVYSQDRGGNEYYDIYVVPANGGEARNLTHTDDISETVDEFSPDGTLLAIGIKQKTSPPTNLAVMEWPSGTIDQLTHESDPKASWSENAWSPDGKFIYATRTVGIDDSDIFRVEVATGKVEKLLEHTGKQLVSVSDVSHDGGTLLISSNAKGGYENVALLDLATKKLRWLTDTQWSARGAAFTPDGGTAVYTLNADGRVSTRFVDLKKMQESERGVPAGMNMPTAAPTPFLPDGSMLLSHEDSSHPQELYRLAKDNTLTQITHNANDQLQRVVLPKSQLVTYKSFDGRLISAFVWIPFNLKRDGTAAAVVMPHGGPTGQTTDTFNGRAELLASRGFVVIAPNVRGSTGYGMEFQNANVKDLGGSDLKDEIAGVDFLKATGFIDPRRVGIWGGSYGGFMTLMAIGKTPDVWAAAVDEYGILNWLSMLEHEDPRLQEYEKSLLGDPVKDRAVYEAGSPLKYIRDEKAPLLVLQGNNDIRVPKEEAEQVVSILKTEGRTVDAVYYPEEGHGFVKREHQRDELTRSVEWLQKYLQGTE
ncbi:MAG TPA: S9 family peptidase [Terracidiphilus sp.]|nr:S9 family peptidase [Terracidiphilus sp.]